jgi:voltage-gated potassium channel
MHPSQNTNESPTLKPWQLKIHEIIFEANTFAGKLFDIVLLIAILLSITVVMLESVDSIREEYQTSILVTEWILTGLFTAEYILRIVSIKKPFKYIFSFYGIIDLVSIIPTYLTLFQISAHSLSVVRSLRLLRVFRVLKLGRFLKEGELILTALKNSRQKIVVFMVAILAIVTIMGTIMYMIESQDAGFTSIPRSIYWAIVTLTTVGYGDIAPETPIGQVFASVIMLLGYAIIAVPTGIMTNELNQAYKKKNNLSHKVCMNCSKEGHDDEALYCDRCGTKL